MTIPPHIHYYWGKAQPSGPGGHAWHPAAYHGLDVAATGEALLAAHPPLLRTLARVAGLAEADARSWFLFALALHDLGKFTDCFQCKAPERWHHKGALGMEVGADPGHGRTGLALWALGCELSSNGLQRFSPLIGATSLGTRKARAAFDIWLAAICGHHGRPLQFDSSTHINDLRGRICAPALADAAAYVAEAAALFHPAPEQPLADDWEPGMRTSSWLVAGLAMLADWIGSNQRWFKYHPPSLPLDAYWEQIARPRARTALQQSGLLAAQVAAHYALADALPGEHSPKATPLQRWAKQRAEITGQSLVIVEDLTGAGKTEAALIVAHRLMQAGAAEGLYWALPTMATADALYARLAASYGRLFAAPQEASLVLAHSAREHNEVFAKSIEIGELRVEQRYGPQRADDNGDDETSASAACTRWLADDRRKTFLADVGVGTIDQAMLGVLPSKHQAMRLAGLCRRVLVIDEIHSLDSYQGALVEALLAFHAALGGSAVLVSATLTTARKQRLASAFAEAAGWGRPVLRENGFPLASIVDGRGAPREAALASSRGTRRDLPVVRLDDAGAAMAAIESAARESRATVWTRNTVQDALDAFNALKARLPATQIDLFHARFALGDRLRIQSDVLQSFGKNSTGDARNRILIATQVVEQSLDADWDVMISDLAPIDLLIQRAGRLHRHLHRAPRPAPMLHVVGPPPADDASARWYEAAFPRGAFVYPHHGQLWLTMRALIETGGLNLASTNPRALLERVYAREADVPKGLEMPSGKAEGRRSSERAVAGMNALDLWRGFVHQGGAWASDTRTPTRLGEPTRMLRLARWDGRTLAPWWPVENGDARRAWRLSEVSVLARRVDDVVISDGSLRRAVEAEQATWLDRYDPPLLVPLMPDGAGGEEWVAHAIDARDGRLQIRYSPVTGLRFVLPAAS